MSNEEILALVSGEQVGHILSPANDLKFSSDVVLVAMRRARNIPAKTAIPESIEQCKVDAHGVAGMIGGLTQEQFAGVRKLQTKILSNVSAYLGKTAKELPEFKLTGIGHLINDSWDGDGINATILAERINKAVGIQLHSIISGALAHKNEIHKSEVTHWKRFAEWVCKDWFFDEKENKWDDVHLDEIAPKTTDELFTLFLAAPPLGEKGKECQHENTISSAGVNFCQDCNTVNPQIKK